MAEWFDFTSFYLFQNLTLKRVDDVWGDGATVPLEAESNVVEERQLPPQVYT